jgi:CelD/BcsL family acetyltransferase involved in cellulose biosynthesis
MTTMQVQEIAAPAELEALGEAWEALFRSDPRASPFQSPAWLLAWRRIFLGEGLWTLAVRDGAHLVALLPMFVYRHDDGRRQLTLLGNGVSDRLDLIAEPGWATEAGRAVLDHIAGRFGLWDCADFRDLPQRSVLLEGAGAVFETAVEAEEPCPARELPGCAEDILAALPRKRRENVARRRRRLGELGSVSVETADATDRPVLLEALLRLHGRRWESRGEAGVLAEGPVQAFHEAATAALLEAGLLQLQVLRLDGRVIAAHYGLRRGDTAYSYIHGFDPEFAAYAPSTLLLVEAMAEAVRQGARRFDFLRGREPYKYDLGAQDQPQSRLRFTPRAEES